MTYFMYIYVYETVDEIKLGVVLEKLRHTGA